MNQVVINRVEVILRDALLMAANAALDAQARVAGLGDFKPTAFGMTQMARGLAQQLADKGLLHPGDTQRD